MENIVFNSEKLYILKPSILLSEETTSSYRELLREIQFELPSTQIDINSSFIEIYKSKLAANKVRKKNQANSRKLKKFEARNINEVTQSCEFQTRIKDVTVATRMPDTRFVFKSVEDNEKIFDGYGSVCHEDDLYVGITPNDKEQLIKYLWNKRVRNTEFTDEIEKYIISLKPLYTMEEIMRILVEIKADLYKTAYEGKDESEPFTLVKTREEPALFKGLPIDSC